MPRAPSDNPIRYLPVGSAGGCPVASAAFSPPAAIGCGGGPSSVREIAIRIPSRRSYVEHKERGLRREEVMNAGPRGAMYEIRRRANSTRSDVLPGSRAWNL